MGSGAIAMFGSASRRKSCRAVSPVGLGEHGGEVVGVEDVVIVVVVMVAVDMDLMVDVGVDVDDRLATDGGAAVDGAHPERGESG